MSTTGLLILSSLLVACFQEDQAPLPHEDSGGVESRLVSSRPKVRPGEWFPIVLVVESADAAGGAFGPPDDGTIPEEGTMRPDSRLIWDTTGMDEYPLLPDLSAVQWPRTRERDGYKGGVLELPLRIYIPVKAAPKAVPGPATLVFEFKGLLAGTEPGTFDEAHPIHHRCEVVVTIVHPTDASATDVSTVDPMLFTGWRGELPDWSVQATRTSRPSGGTPILAWLVFFIPLGVVALVLCWAFLTKRL